MVLGHLCSGLPTCLAGMPAARSIATNSVDFGLQKPLRSRSTLEAGSWSAVQVQDATCSLCHSAVATVLVSSTAACQVCNSHRQNYADTAAQSCCVSTIVTHCLDCLLAAEAGLHGGSTACNTSLRCAAVPWPWLAFPARLCSTFDECPGAATHQIQGRSQIGSCP